MVCKKNMKILAVIPARGGSKGVIKKNIKLLNGKPLIEYTISEALKSKYITDLVVSTDDLEIKSVAEKCGGSCPFIRPSDLATDASYSAPVVAHALEHMEKQNRIIYDSILMLQPTSPFRTSSHIDRSIEKYNSHKCDSVVSVVNVEGNHPFRMKRKVGDKLVNYIDQGFWDMRPRQELPNVYIRNGAIYLIDRDTFIEEKQLIGRNCLGFEMSTGESVNIDNEIDFAVAEVLMKRNRDE